jgi:carboxylesterase type B
VNFTDAGRQLGTNLVTYWTNFGKTLNPNQPVVPSLLWPATLKDSEKYIFFQNPLQVEQDYLKEDCNFFDQIGYKYHYY